MPNMTNRAGKGPRDSFSMLEGKVEILAYKKGVLFDHQVTHNILLYQGLAEVIRTLCSTSPTKPRIITRMAVGDQGTIPSDSTVPKVPVKTATGLYHEFYRKDIDSTVPTFYSPVGFVFTGDTTTDSNVLTNLSDTTGVTVGLAVTGTGIPDGSVVVDIPTPTTVQISNAATSDNAGIEITFAGTVNECQFIATFDAADVPTTAFSNPSTPVLNEVSLVLIDPSASAGLSRDPVTAPDAPETDEVVLSLRTFKSVPFDVGNDVSVTIRYTLFTR